MSELTSEDIEVVEQLENLGWSNCEIADKILHTRMIKQRDLLAADVVTVLKRRRSGEMVHFYGTIAGGSPIKPVGWRDVWDIIKGKKEKKDE